MKKILIISFTILSKDIRVNRQIKLLKDKYVISTVGLKSSDDNNVTFYPIDPIVYKSSAFFRRIKKAFLCKLKMYEKLYWGFYGVDSLLSILSTKKFDLIIANDIESLPFALKISNGAKLFFDAHEYAPRELEDRFIWRFFLKDFKVYLCKKYIRLCDRMITVSDGIAKEYYKDFNIKPDVITNASDYVDIKQSVVNSKFIKLIHHGGAMPSRKIELMIKMMDYLDKRFTLDLMLIPTSQAYFKKLKCLAKNNGRVRLIEPVPMDKIVKFINQYDIGTYILPPINLNHKYALPNKFFDFIQARLAVAIGPSPEMANIVKQYDLGIVAEDFRPEAMAKELNKLTKDKIDYYKCQSDKVAYELSSAGNLNKLENLIAGLLKL